MDALGECVVVNDSVRGIAIYNASLKEPWQVDMNVSSVELVTLDHSEKLLHETVLRAKSVSCPAISEGGRVELRVDNRLLAHDLVLLADGNR